MSLKRIREICKQTGQKLPGSILTPAKAPLPEENVGEETFAHYWRILVTGMPSPVRQYRFDEERRWRADFAWPEQRLVVEISGGCHTVRDMWQRDMEKYNALTERGWRVLTYTPEQLRDDPAGCIEQVCRVLGGNP